MTLQEAKNIAQKGVKVTHRYFTDEEYLTMKENQIIFEDGVKIFFDEWTRGKDWLLEGWEIFKE